MILGSKIISDPYLHPYLHPYLYPYLHPYLHLLFTSTSLIYLSYLHSVFDLLNY